MWVGPPWETAPHDRVSVVIDPGRAFGTGAHPTTRLCLELLQEQEPESLLDVGCGSGVLAIAAAKLGFAPVIALDNDPEAIEATQANAEANGVSLEIELVDVLTKKLPLTAVGVCNISIDAIEAIAPSLGCQTLIASGFLASDRPSFRGFRLCERREEAEWAAFLASKTA